MVFGWLRDCLAGGDDSAGDTFPSLDPSQPVYIVELGCGSGRFGYLFLIKLLDMLGRSVLQDVAIKYIYTDFTEYHLDIPATSDYYDDPAWNRILESYRERLADSAVLFPRDALARASEALELDPDFEGARDLRAEIQAAMKPSTE